MSRVLIHRALVPGLLLSVAVALVALSAEWVEIRLTGMRWVDGLVFAILAGTAVRSLLGMDEKWQSGIRFASKELLEIAIVLLGATISFATLIENGPWMIVVVALAVLASLILSYLIGRALGLSDRLATLVACGNSICGNSAIVAAAPVIDAESGEVAASIAFTATLGIVVVLLLPLVPSFFGLNEAQYGVVAGMTVYAVPQVLAATMPVGVLSTQIGATVKLMRVLMLGPVIVLLSLKIGRRDRAAMKFCQMLPWFIVGFLCMIGARSMGLLPQTAVPVFRDASTVLTIVSMAALGLSVDIRTVFASGGRVLAAGVFSLMALAGLSAGILLVVEI